jgi:hypothetical protein
VNIDVVVDGPRGGGLAPARAEFVFDASRTVIGPLALLGPGTGLRLRLRAEYVADGTRRVRNPAERREELLQAAELMVACGADIDREAFGHTAWSLSLAAHVPKALQVLRTANVWWFSRPFANG